MIYTIQRGDTPSSIAQRFTGWRGYWPQIVKANPQLARRMTSTGYATFDQTGFRPGVKLRIPMDLMISGWKQGRGIVGQQATITPGVQTGKGYEPPPAEDEPPDPTPAAGSCNPGSAIKEIKPYVYIVQAGEFPSTITQKWGIETGGQGRPWKWHELRRANADDPDGFIVNAQGVCVWANWRAGKKLRIPGNWPEPPAHMKGNTEPYDPGDFGATTTGGGGTGPGETGVETVGWGGESLTGGAGTPTWLILALAGVAAGGGYLLVSTLGKKKRG